MARSSTSYRPQRAVKPSAAQKLRLGGRKPKAPPPGTYFEDPNEWLKRNKVTKAPTKYATGMASGLRTGRGIT
jgi:hypothetical protein